MLRLWNKEALCAAPRTFPATRFSAPGVRSLFFEGESYDGKPTRVFAWMGMPYVPAGKKCPGMVLLHGGGGTAYDEWVRIWNRRGYAAITFDQCGCTPGKPLRGSVLPHRLHRHAGPPGWNHSFDRARLPLEEQWPCHAVAAAMRAHSLLAAQPGVDPGRIGVTGISWGGYLTGLVAGVDTRLKCAVPVYGCGALGHNSAWKDDIFPKLRKSVVARWLKLWDPLVYLPHAAMPFCWVTGTNDGAYPLDSLQKSYALPPGDRTLCVRVAMPHSHTDGWAPAEIGTFVDSVLCGGAPLPRITRSGMRGRRLGAHFTSVRPVVKAEICFTRALGKWVDRRYNVRPARLDPDAHRVEADILPGTTVCFLNLYDDRQCMVSTPHIELPVT